MDPAALAPVNPQELERLSRELAEARADAERARTLQQALLSALSREVRTPMHAIIGTTSLLLESGLNAEGRELAETIKRGCDALLELVTNVIDLSATESGSEVTKPASFELPTLIEEVLGAAATPAEAKGLTLSSFLPSYIPSVLRGDRARLARLLSNLVGIAIRFGAPGELTIEAKKIDEGVRDLRVRFEVREASVGLTKTAAAEIEAAFSGATSDRSHLDPISVAVAISRRLCQALGGELGVESHAGRGSCFWLEARFGKSNTAAAPIPDLMGARILVIEDHAQLRRSIGHYLAIAGARAESAAGGNEALDRIKSADREGRGYALVITGAHLPDMDASRLVRKVRSTGLAILPFIRLREGRRVEQPTDELFAGELDRPVRREALYDACLLALDLKRSPSAKAPRSAVERRILIAEDHPLSQKVAARMLEGLGYRADVVGDGHEVLAALQKQHYDLVLMDCMMPEMDGLSATTEIRRREAKAPGAPVRIVAMTASAMTGDRERCLAAGMDDYLSKPVQASELSAMLRRWL